jgi:NADH dehydrogenase/NADH:ubiquinone oxidoreductase subunit G
MYLITENNALAEEVIGKIVEVLGREHRTAQAANETGEARAILHVAHAFANELAAARPDFDRLRFIREITEHGHDGR